MAEARLNPHLHVVFLDGTYHEDSAQLAWQDLGWLKTHEVGQVLERTVRRIDSYLRRSGMCSATDPEADRRRIP